MKVPFENCAISDPGIHSWQDYRSGYVQVTSLLESEGIMLVYCNSSDQDLNRNKLWSMDTVLDVTLDTYGI